MTANPLTWRPNRDRLAAANVTWLMERTACSTARALQEWSAKHRQEFWTSAIERLGIVFRQSPHALIDVSRGVEVAEWLPGAEFNIVDSCFRGDPDAVAIVHQCEGGPLETWTLRELETLTERVAAGLTARGYRPGDAIGVFMPMTAEAVAICLGIIKAGCAVVGVAESFRPKEIASRLKIAGAVAIFTQDVCQRGGKEFPLYDVLIEAEAPAAIVLGSRPESRPKLRPGDTSWAEFLPAPGTTPTVMRRSQDPITILFSSGTTGEPKAIPWNQTTPIKCATDAHFHQDVHAGDLLVWPTSLGWMMGPWLIFASLINRAAMGLFDGSPLSTDFGRFVQDSRATLLGVVPTLVQKWRASNEMDAFDWSGLKLISSTGECSCADDMAWLMAKAGHKPIIEYCGGTEIGGGYISSLIAEPCTAGTFNSPALGLDFVILDENGASAPSGELFLTPPSIGLSTSLLNKDHHDIYYADTPRGPGGDILRRHGDRMERLADGTWRALGRADDTMNLGGIKVSSAEIEQAVRTVDGVHEAAAIAVSAAGGPSLLVVFAVAGPPWTKETLTAAMQSRLRSELNPLFKIHEVVLVDALPRTASNKVMRRTLRGQYTVPL